MKKDLIISAVAGAAIALVVGGIFVFTRPAQLAGDFPGGIVPSNLFTASAANNSVTPVLSNLLVNGAVSAGGTAAANQTVQQFTATTSYPTASTVTLGPVSASTSTTSTSINIPFGGFSIGDPCSEIFYNGASSSAPLVSYDGNITAVGSGSATATVIFFNASSSSVVFNTTSSATGASSTLKVTCRHAGV
jgi:hypothetical protein